MSFLHNHNFSIAFELLPLKKHVLIDLNILFILLIILNKSSLAYSPGCIEVQKNYRLIKVRESEFGNPFSMALHPDGSVILGDQNNNRIVRIKDGKVTTVLASDNIKTGLVAVLPNGKVVYTSFDGQIYAYDIDTNLSTFIGRPPQPEWIAALTTDLDGHIYFTTNLANIYIIDENGAFNRIVDSLPFFGTDGYGNSLIGDMAVSLDKTICVSGPGRVVAVQTDDTIKIIADNLRNEPVNVTASPDNFVYINDNGNNFIKYNPVTGSSTFLHFDNVFQFGDVLAPSTDELIIYEAHNMLYRYHLPSHSFTVLSLVTGNSLAFAADGNNTVFFSTPSKTGVIKSHIVRLSSDGNTSDVQDLTYSRILSIDVDRRNRLCLATDEGFVRHETDGTVTAVSPLFFDNNWISGPLQFKLAVGPNDYWYTISSYYDGLVRVHRFSENSDPIPLPITFNRDPFGKIDYELMFNVSMDIGPDGRLALIVSATGINFQAPFYQRVYRADADGKNLAEVANLDSPHRTGGPVDIAVGPDDSLFVLSVQDEGEFIYRIDKEGNITEFVTLCSGNDPSSIDVDPGGNLWFSTTNGIYRVLPRDDDSDGMPNFWEEQYGLNPLVNDASDDPDNDGFSNIQEYRADTDPKNPASHPCRNMSWIPLLLLNE